MGIVLQQGTTIAGRYRILGAIGQGGMGDVYAAEDLRLDGRLRAVKVNRPPSSDGHYKVEEAALLMRLDHPRLPAIVDYCPPDNEGVEIVVMEYIDGYNLRTFMDQSGEGLSLLTVIAIGVQLADVLNYLHGQCPPIIHRDLKPTNVMIDRTGEVRLIDFGIARSYKEGAHRDTSLLGTPGFAAPEQNGQSQSDARTDIYGLGALLFYVLGGGRARTANAALPDHVPVDLRGIVYRMLEPRATDRYKDMEEVGRALAGVHARLSGPIGPSWEGSPAMPRHRQDEREIANINFGRVHPSANLARQIVVASLSPGAGASFVAITLAILLAERGLHCAAMEHAAVSPEWYALLDSSSLVPYQANKLLDPRYERYIKEGVQWHMLRPNRHAEDLRDDGRKLNLMIEQLACDVLVIDLSGSWMLPEAEQLLQNADHLVMVADPFPSKWTMKRLAAAEKVQLEREAAGRATHWVLNKDVPFSRRKEWMDMLPRRPVAAIPQLPPDKLVNLLWEGRWITEDRRLRKQVKTAFEALNRKFFEI
ncbi:serine/threonine-protein kinase [Paenibacillus phyllosphaerae]|uniref:Serine/threonine-protein kinase n=1 Tax=Paenibacillus phyllosphaerae TaxID=274593 RepID=A0A7W5AX45_9BACL|nr:serine/threonine-protein kinase [Paenibacillus phyllosphaerae]MBB3110348.1 serine/threonine-protein kinase [Paenibacillus phyllosphaerae]